MVRMKSNYTRVRPPLLRPNETPAGGFVGRGGALNDQKKVFERSQKLIHQQHLKTEEISWKDLPRKRL
jgi:hypothetical protein